jgi:hypothetical protein
VNPEIVEAARLKPCPSCPGFILDGAARCPDCRKPRRRPPQRSYGRRRWRDARVQVVKDAQCVDCGRDATDADHVPPRQLLVALGILDPDHPRWLEPRCHRCHGRVTRLVDQPILDELAGGDLTPADLEALAERAIAERRRARPPSSSSWPRRPAGRPKAGSIEIP